MNFRTTPVYQNAYATTRNIMEGKLKVAAKKHAQTYQQGYVNAIEYLAAKFGIDLNENEIINEIEEDLLY